MVTTNSISMHNKYTLIIFFLSVFCLSFGQGTKLESASLFNKELAPHPRLILTPEREENIKLLLEKGDTTLLHLVDLNQQVANELLEKTVQNFRYSSRGNILNIARETLKRVTVLGTAYRLTGDERYAEKLVENVMNVCAFSDWNTKHYLDVAELSTAVAIAYDWMYDYLSSEQKEIIRQAWEEKALKPSLERLDGFPFDKENNWNTVCNTGISIGCLAFAKYYPQEAELFLKGTTQDTMRMPRCLQAFAPDGVCYEGAAYWGYTMRYLVLYMDAMDYNFPNDERFAIGELPGLKETLHYRLATITPSGMLFRFADVGEFDREAPLAAYYFLSQKYDYKAMADYQSDLVNNEEFTSSEFQRTQMQALSIAWYVEGSGHYSKSTEAGLEVFRGPTSTDIVVFNGGQAEADIFLMAKTGSPSMSHQHLDASSFVVEVNGQTVFHDMGAESYNVPNFWKRDPEAKRWHYFKTSSKSHNVIEIDDEIQYSYGRSELKDYSTTDAQPYVLMDNTSLYPSSEQVLRRLTLLDSKTIKVTDQIQLKSGDSEVTWRGFLWGSEVSVDGNKLTLIGEDDGRFYLKIVEAQGAVFSSLEEPQLSLWLTQGLDEAPYYKYLRPLSDQVLRSEIRVKPKDGEKDIQLSVVMSADSTIFED